MNEIEPMMTQREVAEYIAHILRVSERHVYDRYVHLPGFPKASLLPHSNRKRYNRDEIIEWTDKQRRAA